MVLIRWRARSPGIGVEAPGAIGRLISGHRRIGGIGEGGEGRVFELVWCCEVCGPVSGATIPPMASLQLFRCRISYLRELE